MFLTKEKSVLWSIINVKKAAPKLDAFWSRTTFFKKIVRHKKHPCIRFLKDALFPQETWEKLQSAGGPTCLSYLAVKCALIGKIMGTPKLIVRTSNHVLYVSNVSRLGRPNLFSICARKEKKFWPIASLDTLLTYYTWLEVRPYYELKSSEFSDPPSPMLRVFH